jgi:hypothetical protein
MSVVPAPNCLVLSVRVPVAATTESIGSTTLSTSEQMASPAQLGLALVKPRNGSMYCDTDVTLSRSCCMPPCMASIPEPSCPRPRTLPPRPFCKCVIAEENWSKVADS